MKVIKPIIIIAGEPNSIFSEILTKAFNLYRSSKPLILICSYDLLTKQIKKLKIKLDLNLITSNFKNFNNLKNNRINVIDISYKFNKPFEKISSNSNTYISKCFEEALEIIKNHKVSGLINGPISKKFFLRKKYPGVTEYLSKTLKINKKFCMLIYNKNLSVSPVTTHLPISKVPIKINKKDIIIKSLLISKFFSKHFLKKPKIGISGLNPHCENFFGSSEEIRIIKPAIKILKKKKVDISGPYPADTIFLSQNIKKFDVIIGMYHDQVLAPVKALFGFNAINITLGLPFLRVSPDHGPNFEMIGKNKSDPKSLIESIKFLDKIR